MNAGRSIKKENVLNRAYAKPEALNVKQMNLTTDNTSPEKVIQPQGLHTEQPVNIVDEKSNISMNISRADENQATEIHEETPDYKSGTSTEKYLGAPVNELTIHRIDNIWCLFSIHPFIMRGRDNVPDKAFQNLPGALICKRL
jgi:hypothetical protein